MLKKLLSVASVIVLMVVLFVLIVVPPLGRMFYPLTYRGAIERAAAEFSLDPYLLASLIYVESRFNPQAVSIRGARGLMQIMPDTGAWIAQEMRGINYENDLLFDPEINIFLGSWYLANLYKEFANIYLSLAAYNAGRGNVKKWLENGVWNGDFEQINQIPFRETRNYLEKIFHVLKRYEYLYQF